MSAQSFFFRIHKIIINMLFIAKTEFITVYKYIPDAYKHAK